MTIAIHSGMDRLKHASHSRKLELKAEICGQAIRFSRASFEKGLRAIMLTGSMARDEAIVVADESGEKVLGDAEFLLVFDEKVPLPDDRAIGFLCRRIQEELLRFAIDCPVSMGQIHPAFLTRLRPNIFAFELHENGQVIWGDTAVLALIRPFEKSSIPLEDGWRLLSNRIIEQLSISLMDATDPLPLSVFSQTAKLYLDSAASLLLFGGDYAPTFRRRQENLSNWAAKASPAALFPLAPFAEAVAGVTRWRLGESGENPPATFEFLRTAMERAQELWVWELKRLTGSGEKREPQDLMFEWMKCQPRLERLRGWLYVLRAQGWVRSWRHWPRWARLAWRSSPRYWIYAAAAKLLFSAPAPLNCGRYSRKSDWIGVREWLPLKSSWKSKELLTWQELAQEIVWNYKTFLVETRT
jgi:hypothetical protein